MTTATTELKRQRLLRASVLQAEGEAGRLLARRYFARHLERWLHEVMVTPSSASRVQPMVPTDDDLQVIRSAIEWQRYNRMAREAKTERERWQVAYAVVYDWLYREGGVTPCLRGKVGKQWQEVEHVIRRLPQWMRPEGWSKSEHLTEHAIINPQSGALVTRPAMSLKQFIKEAWHVLEPNVYLSWSWHLDRMCEAAELTSKGQERNMAINVPPGSMKSLTFAVFWPAWEWSFNPTIQWLCASHNVTLARRDTEKCGKLISSAWYEQRYGRVRGKITTNAKETLELKRGGSRRITSPGSGTTGWRADRLLCDDLISVENAFSTAKRESSNDWYMREFSNRVNDPERSSRTIIAQRVHEKDVFSLLMRDPSYAWIVFPTRFKPGRFAENRHDKRRFLFEDERLVAGDLLHPERINAATDVEQELVLGPIGYASQHDQEPRSDGGGLVHYEWMDAGSYLDVPRMPGRFVQVWDLRNGGDVLKTSTSFAVGQLWFKPDAVEEVYLIDQVRGKWDILETEDMLLAMQADPLWGRAQEVVVENKADGRALLKTLAAKIPALVPYDPGSRQKLQRWQAVLGYWKALHVHLPDPSLPRSAPWIEEFRREHYLGLGAPHNDQLDTSAMGIHYMLSQVKTHTDPWAAWFD
jgi:hypothetical protein